MSRGGGGGSSSKLASWLWRAPRRPLGRARNLYVRSLTGCTGHLSRDSAFGYPSFAAAATLPCRADSFFFGSSSSRAYRDDRDDGLWELIRAASQKRAAAEEPVTVPRSQSVAMARIDEDRPCEFAGAAAGVAFGSSRRRRRPGRWTDGEGRGSRLVEPHVIDPCTAPRNFR